MQSAILAKFEELNSQLNYIPPFQRVDWFMARSFPIYGARVSHFEHTHLTES